MINENIIKSILPDCQDESKILICLFSICLISCALTILTPSVPIKFIIIIMFLFGVLLFRMHIFQILLLVSLVGLILPENFAQIKNLSFAVVLMISIGWIGVRKIFYNEMPRHYISSDIQIAIYLIFAINGVISTALNATFGSLAMGEIIRYILYACLIGASYYFIDNIFIIKKILWTTVAVSTAVAIYSYRIAMTIGIKSFLIHGMTIMHGAFEGLSNSNPVAGVISNGMVVVLAYILFGKIKKYRQLNLALFIFMFIVWVLWNSRGAYLYILFSFITLILFHKDKWKYLSVMSVLFIGFSFLIFSNAFPAFKVLLRLEGGMTYRADIWAATYKMFLESPILGKGLGFFDKFKYEYMVPGLGRMMAGNLNNITPHNILLMRAVDFGIGAILLQLISWTMPVIIFFKNSKLIKDSEYYYLYVAGGAIWIGLMARSFFDTTGNVFGLMLLGIIIKMPDIIRRGNRSMESIGST